MTMALVLSEQKNIDLLLVLVKLTIALAVIVIGLLLLFFLRLKNLEKRMDQGRKHLKSRFPQSKPQSNLLRPLQKSLQKPRQKALVTTQTMSHRPNSNLSFGKVTTSETKVYRATPKNKSIQKFPSHKSRSRDSRWQWLFAILIASITGVAIAVMQLGNTFIRPEFMPLVWLLIGVMLVITATFVEVT